MAIALQVLKRSCPGHVRTAVKLIALKTSAFDLVLMDIRMPVMNGLDALREIRGKEQGACFHQPVIALTAWKRMGFYEKGLTTMCRNHSRQAN